jgi:hypothetical protein
MNRIRHVELIKIQNDQLYRYLHYVFAVYDNNIHATRCRSQYKIEIKVIIINNDKQPTAALLILKINYPIYI